MPYKDKSLAGYAGLEEKEVMEELGSSLQGLSTGEAERRLSLYGQNQIAERKELHIILEFLSHFKSPLILILLIASIVSAFFDEIVDAAIIGVIIILSVMMDFFLEHTAHKAAEKLKEGVKTRVNVMRDGAKKEIGYAELCEGDIIFLSAGSLVPADARIISEKDFFVNQSALTGESFPSEKTNARIAAENMSVTELRNIVFMGTNVVSGSATAVVVKTGKHTQFGGIAAKLSAAPEQTEFDRGIASFGSLIMKAIIFLVLFIFLFNSIVKHNVLQSFMFALAVAVGLTPELLPMIMSVTMAKGSMNMAKKGVIVKKLSSINNFGSMDILCTDKTGTLTEDRIKLVRYTDISGRQSEEVLSFAYLNSSNQTGIKNPLDEAVMEFKHISAEGYRKIDEIPFDFVRKKMSVVVEKAGRPNKRYLITKGAPESIFLSCRYYKLKGKKVSLTQKSKEEITRLYHDLSMQGYRVLGVAVKEVAHERSYTKYDEKDMMMLGFMSFLDPPKEDAGEMIQYLKSIGVDVKIITGDNELVTKKICDDLRIPIKGILLGNEISHITDDALKVKVENTTIFARFSPDEKNRIIHALKSNGHVVGFLGDGINDAPSMRTADIGISVNSGVDVAKESAHIVLTQKSLKVLGEGILEGRKTFGNTMKYVMMGLSSNFGNMFSVAGAILVLPFLPMLPAQILLNNFIYDFSQITIPNDNVDDEFIRKPKRWNMKFIKRFMIFLGPVSSIFDFLTFFALFWLFHLPAGAFQTGWFIESLATQTLVIQVIRTKKMPFFQSTASKSLIISSILCVALGWVLPYTPFGKFFGFVPLPAYVLLSIAGIVAVYLICVEAAKRLFYKRYDF
ncbi:magnesium-translocating P-type ATPase [Candidatus Woesearchaeota archaeon CG10_big_fil_rev_8_21_14_0_10_44_13]|nr:MAG: magnesium-translocating P-type ATPase [Candidatus Woesearchaeota archaeon CG10_big_fil_rev_8_21_14_0_10_44_13]